MALKAARIQSPESCRSVDVLAVWAGPGRTRRERRIPSAARHCPIAAAARAHTFQPISGAPAASYLRMSQAFLCALSAGDFVAPLGHGKAQEAPEKSDR